MQVDTHPSSQFDMTFVVLRIAAIAGLIVSIQVCIAALLLQQNNDRSQSSVPIHHIQLNH